jgi:hypothetical protein
MFVRRLPHSQSIGGATGMNTLIRELRYALRRLRGSPGFTIAAMLTLAVAIGATASVFSVVDGVLFKAFPFRDPDRVMLIRGSNPSLHLPQYGVTPADYLDWRQQNSGSTLAAAQFDLITVTGTQEPERVTRAIVTPS